MHSIAHAILQKLCLTLPLLRLAMDAINAVASL
jgi:hypothetical protein